MAAEKKKKSLSQDSFFQALKLIAIRQSGKSLSDCEAEVKLGILGEKSVEQPFPIFKNQEIESFRLQMQDDGAEPDVLF